MTKELTPKDEITEFLLYTTPNGKVKVEIFLHNENIWLTQDKIALLFGVQRPAITKHLKNIFESKELIEKAVSSILEHTAEDQYEKYRLIQDRVLESDFDRVTKKLLNHKNKGG